MRARSPRGSRAALTGGGGGVCVCVCAAAPRSFSPISRGRRAALGSAPARSPEPDRFRKARAAQRLAAVLGLFLCTAVFGLNSRSAFFFPLGGRGLWTSWVRARYPSRGLFHSQSTPVPCKLAPSLEVAGQAGSERTRVFRGALREALGAARRSGGSFWQRRRWER